MLYLPRQFASKPLPANLFKERQALCRNFPQKQACNFEHGKNISFQMGMIKYIIL